MKYFFFLLCSLFFYSTEYGQSQTVEDSLYNQWQNTNLPDSTRLDALDLLSWNIMNVDIDSSIVLATILKEEALSRNNPSFLLYSLNTLGVAYWSKGDFPNALEYMLEALSTAKKNQILDNIGSLYNNIGNIYTDKGDFQTGLKYYEQSLDIALDQNNADDIASAYLNIGILFQIKGLNSKATDYFLKAMDLIDQLEDEYLAANIYAGLATMYKDEEKSLELYEKSLAIYQEENDLLGEATIYLNLANLHVDNKEYEKAILYVNKALDINEKMEVYSGLLDNYQLFIDIYFRTDSLDKAQQYLNQMMELSKETQNQISELTALISYARLNELRKNPSQVEYWGLKAWELGNQINSISGQESTSELLYSHFKSKQNYKRALTFLEEQIVLRDSLKENEADKKIKQLEFQQAFIADSIRAEEEKLELELAYQQEVYTQEKNRNLALGVALLIIVIATFLGIQLKFTRKAKSIIEKEKNRSEELLLNILPHEIAEELKEKGEAEARLIEQVSIIFTDFKGFTQASEKLTAQELVREIDTCFKAFDHIIGKYQIEKIKTIGDAYMAAGNLPSHEKDSVEFTIRAALEMQEYIQKRKKEREQLGKFAFDMRMGVHTGPVVAGIVGVKKFQYDIWGDTVNTASRMESSGEVGKVNISEMTYSLIKENPSFNFEYRGRIMAKGKGEISMYFVDFVEENKS